MIRSLERRVAKLELRRELHRGLFFLAWGGNEDEVEAVLRKADAAGLIFSGETVIRAAWPGPGSMPRSRWVKDEIGALSRDEDDALGKIVDSVYAERIVNAEAAGCTAPNPGLTQ